MDKISSYFKALKQDKLSSPVFFITLYYSFFPTYGSEFSLMVATYSRNVAYCSF